MPTRRTSTHLHPWSLAYRRMWSALVLVLALVAAVVAASPTPARAASLPADGSTYVIVTGQRYVFNVSLSECGLISLGTQGSCAASSQWMLNEFNRAGLVVDGYYGPATAAATAAYQRRKGLTVDSIIGSQVRAAFANDYRAQRGPADALANVRGDDAGFVGGPIIVFPNPDPRGRPVRPINQGCAPNTSNYFGLYQRFNCVTSYKDNYNRGESVWLREGYYDPANSKGTFGLVKALNKHGLNMNTIAIAIVNGSRTDEAGSTRVVYRLQHKNPATGKPDIIIRVVADRAPGSGSPDNYWLGLMTAYCEGFNPQCPPGINEMVAANI